jgi:hypothetical protein
MIRSRIIGKEMSLFESLGTAYMKESEDEGKKRGNGYWMAVFLNHHRRAMGFVVRPRQPLAPTVPLREGEEEGF